MALVDNRGSFTSSLVQAPQSLGALVQAGERVRIGPVPGTSTLLGNCHADQALAISLARSRGSGRALHAG